MILTGLLHFFYIAVCIILILVVLLQKGKRADLAGAFGGGGSQTAFGARGAANALTKLTTGAAVTFMVLALTLSVLASRRASTAGSVLDDVPDPVAATEPAPEVPADDALPVLDDPVDDGTAEDAVEGAAEDAVEDAADDAATEDDSAATEDPATP
jgi:preprotein translocase subunit SecG